MSSVPDYIVIGEALNIQLESFADEDGTPLTDASAFVVVGSVKDAIDDADGAAIDSVNSALNDGRVVVSEDSDGNASGRLTVHLLSHDVSDDLLNRITIQDTGLTVKGLPVVGYVYADVWVTEPGSTPTPLYFKKLPVIKPTTLAK